MAFSLSGCGPATVRISGVDNTDAVEPGQYDGGNVELRRDYHYEQLVMTLEGVPSTQLVLTMCAGAVGPELSPATGPWSCAQDAQECDQPLGFSMVFKKAWNDEQHGDDPDNGSNAGGTVNTDVDGDEVHLGFEGTMTDGQQLPGVFTLFVDGAFSKDDAE